MVSARAFTICAVVFLSLQARAAVPPCELSVEVTPHAVVVGQPLTHHITILRRPDVTAVVWVQPPSFPGFRAEPLGADAGPDWVERAGTRYLRFVERRALFAVRSGARELPPATLSCHVGAVDSKPETNLTFDTPPLTIRVAAPPEDGRPSDFHGVIGPIVLTRKLAPAEIRVGESAQLVVEMRGGGNLWDARALAPEVSELDVFPQSPIFHTRTLPAFRVDRTAVYELVPRSPGSHRLAPASVAFFDPKTGRYGRAEAPALVLRALPPAPAAEPPASTTANEPRAGSSFGWAAFTIAVVIAIFAGWRWHGRASVSDPISDFETAAQRFEREGTATALRQLAEALERATAINETVPDAARALARNIERARFAEGGGAPTPDQIQRALRALRGVE